MSFQGNIDLKSEEIILNKERKQICLISAGAKNRGQRGSRSSFSFY
jgi:hypothetical protein